MRKMLLQEQDRKNRIFKREVELTRQYLKEELTSSLRGNSNTTTTTIKEDDGNDNDDDDDGETTDYVDAIDA